MQAIGMLAAGLPAGSLADRYDSRTIVIVTEAARAAVTAGVVLALVAGRLSLPLLLAAAALLGVGQAVKGAAGLLLMRSVVTPDQLTRALTQDEVRMNGAAPAGVAGCGLLLQYLPAQAAMLTLAAIEAAGVAYCSTKRQLWQARWPADHAA